LQQVLPELMRMLVEVVQLGAPSEACAATMAAIMPVYQQDLDVWRQPAGAAAVSNLVLLLGPAVLHAVQQQRQQQEELRHCQYAVWHWAVALGNAVGAGVFLKGQARVLHGATCSSANCTWLTAPGLAWHGHAGL
jgi:hypothetical protein